MDNDKRKAFVELTEKALLEDNIDKLIEDLLERNSSVEYLMKDDVNISEVAEEYLSKETKILKILENERKKLLIEMDKLSKNKAATKKYSPKFPFPPLPVFFEKKG
ncbi:MAG: hypothetical protein NT178_13085 [Proteobacteria bacterium]|nr:hypothetical protein [Pseudomonadota bacterium]